MPVVVSGLGDQLTIAGNALPSATEVRVRAPKLAVVAHQYLGIALGRVEVDLSDWAAQPARNYEFSPLDVDTEAEVVAILSPDRFPLRVDHEDSRRLPIRVPLRGRLAADRRLAGEVTVEPDSLDVTGPRRYFAGVDSLGTEAIDLASIDRTLVQEMPLIPPPAPLAVPVSTVKVTVPVVALAERVLANVPVIALIGRQQGEAGISPPVCDVMVRGPADSVAALSPARLSVTVLVSDLEPGTHQIAGEVQCPDWVLDVRIQPEVFMVLVGETAPAGGEG
jgi:YbbR domain-containing protein